jgi:hypothetical protein
MLIIDYNTFYNFSKAELYNNEFNEKLFNILNNTFGLKLYLLNNIDNFNMLKLKEFYVLNDLDVLNTKTDKLININIFSQFKAFKNLMNNNFYCIK